MYFEIKGNGNNIMKEVCVWFRFGKEHAYTLPEFAIVLGLYEAYEIKHRLFEVHFGSLLGLRKGMIMSGIGMELETHNKFYHSHI